ncbi:DUF551 domain-containing protein [Burkholderia multivorans]|uniref:DUF551 domain-containing protein n=1 Tax=Burkholderia multivorans TaxID=87883 RepID=UPI00201A13E1|nr:DUF551 domain-containing protein [Burkholderia multivorans]UQN68050.1 DUF551 domain-containing protein [Burkholderia multivorans]UQN73779.1 DUF551 domain-containing protein [Burkholderia multivorans]
MDEREMKFVALMRKMGISKSDPTWTALEIVWDKAWSEAKGPIPLRDDGFDNEDKPGSWSPEEWNLGRWLSAALDDPNACAEFKEDVERWFRSLGRRTTPDREAWISVAERLPESPGNYLLFRPAAHLPPASDPNITIREFFGRGKVGGDRFGGAHAVTHWMPLPAAPTSDQGEKS